MSRENVVKRAARGVRAGSGQHRKGLARRLVAVLVAAPLLAASLLAGGTVGAAQAATSFVSDPAAKSELDRQPSWVTMVFKFELDPSTAKMLVLNSSGENVTTGELAVEWTNVRAQLQADLPDDTYTVHYRVSKRNGEPRGGTFQFALGEGTWTADGETSWKGSDEEPEVMKNPNPNATTAAAEPSESATPSATPTPVATPTPTPSVSAPGTPSVTPPAAPSADAGSGSGALLWAGVIGVLAVLASAAGALWYRKRRGTPTQ